MERISDEDILKNIKAILTAQGYELYYKDNVNGQNVEIYRRNEDVIRITSGLEDSDSLEDLEEAHKQWLDTSGPRCVLP